MDAGVRMGRIKAGAANFFMGVVGSILSSWFTVGASLLAMLSC